MNTAKNAYDKILNGISVYKAELAGVCEQLDSFMMCESYNPACPEDKEDVDCMIDEKARIRAIIFGLTLALSLTYNEAKKGFEAANEPF